MNSPSFELSVKGSGNYREIYANYINRWGSEVVKRARIRI